jgi:tRNA wybutosine-synthesizing protein 3
MNKQRDFLDGKKIALEKLEKAKNNCKVDQDILPILNIINSSDKFYTSSSCYGRIVVLEIPKIGDKKNARFLGKWHRPIIYDELVSAFKNAKKGQIWILAQSPIIHLIAKTTNDADRILKVAYSCGFKHSGYKSLENKYVVEICSTERLDAPIGQDSEVFCKENYLKLLMNISNQILEKSKIKLDNFESKIKKHLSSDKSTNNSGKDERK